MSSVRMCDDCGIIFSENTEGWGVGTVAKMVRNEKTGRIEPKELAIDYCPECVLKREMGTAANASNRVLATETERRAVNGPESRADDRKGTGGY